MNSARAAANINAAKAQMEQAKAQLDLLKAGATAEQIAVAEAGVKQAQVAVDTAKAQLDKLQLIAPFDGTIGTVYVRSGEVAQPGQSIVTLGDLGSLRVETTDLSETDVARVKEGQPVKVTFDALPGKTISGKVTRIAPMSTPGQSAVNYIVTVAAGRDRSGAALGHDGVCRCAGGTVINAWINGMTRCHPALADKGGFPRLLMGERRASCCVRVDVRWRLNHD